MNGMTYMGSLGLACAVLVGCSDDGPVDPSGSSGPGGSGGTVSDGGGSGAAGGMAGSGGAGGTGNSSGGAGGAGTGGAGGSGAGGAGGAGGGSPTCMVNDVQWVGEVDGIVTNVTLDVQQNFYDGFSGALDQVLSDGGEMHLTWPGGQLGIQPATGTITLPQSLGGGTYCVGTGSTIEIAAKSSLALLLTGFGTGDCSAPTPVPGTLDGCWGADF